MRHRPSSKLVLATAAATLLSLTAISAQAQTDLQSELQADFETVADKLVQLAEAIPADKYSWRPADGVRSVSESLMHVAAANYFFPSLVGQAMPEGVNPRAFEKEHTEKDDVLEVFKGSLKALTKMLELGDLDKDVAFGKPMSRLGFYHTAISHSHEHLGQMIAYARSIGVAPPWSQSPQ